MLVEADFVAERFVADLAGKGPFAVVRSTGVHFQAVRSGEHLFAFDAGKVGGIAAASAGRRSGASSAGRR